MEYKVFCKYCGHGQNFRISDLLNPDIEDLNDALKYDQEYSCSKCGCFVRVNEALEQETLKEYGYA